MENEKYSGKYWKLYRCTFDRLSNAERFTLAYIEQFSRGENACDASQDYIAQRLQIDRKTVTRCIKRLEEKKLRTVKRTAPKKAGTWRREKNRYTVNRETLDHVNKVWKKTRTGSAQRLPDVLKVKDTWLQALGASTQCILVANLYQVQQAAQNKPAFDLLADGVQYSQADIAMQCGCGVTVIKDALSDLKERGIIEECLSNLNWKKSRKCYILYECNIAGNVPSVKPEMSLAAAENVPSEQAETAGNVENNQHTEEEKKHTAGNVPSIQPEMSLVIAGNVPSIQPEMSHNEYIDEYTMNAFMNTDRAAVVPIPRGYVSSAFESDIEHKARAADRVRAFMEMDDSALEAALTALNRKDGEQ